MNACGKDYGRERGRSALQGHAARIAAKSLSVLVSPNIGSPSAPEIIAVNGDLSLSGNVTGYGILLGTGTLSMGGNVGWNGIVLVIGQGNFKGMVAGTIPTTAPSSSQRRSTPAAIPCPH